MQHFPHTLKRYQEFDSAKWIFLLMGVSLSQVKSPAWLFLRRFFFSLVGFVLSVSLFTPTAVFSPVPWWKKYVADHMKKNACVVSLRYGPYNVQSHDHQGSCENVFHVHRLFLINCMLVSAKRLVTDHITGDLFYVHLLVLREFGVGWWISWYHRFKSVCHVCAKSDWLALLIRRSGFTNTLILKTVIPV